jgi:SOS-response transcriptional repressor LexA
MRSGTIVGKKLSEKGMTQTELAQRIGKTHGSISNWIRGTHEPSDAIAASICTVLGIDFQEISRKLSEERIARRKKKLRRELNITLGDEKRPIAPTSTDEYRQAIYQQAGVWLEDVILVPVVGSIPAGGTVGVEELRIGVEEYEYIPAAAVPEAKGIFGLRVAGNSMTINDIRENDIIIVDTAIERQNGDIVLLSVDSQVMLRRMHCLEDHCIFQAEHREPFFCKAEMCNEVIIGKVIRVIKEK